MIWGESGREKTQPDQGEPDPHSQRTERGSERGERVRLGRVRMREDLPDQWIREENWWSGWFGD